MPKVTWFTGPKFKAAEPSPTTGEVFEYQQKFDVDEVFSIPAKTGRILTLLIPGIALMINLNLFLAIATIGILTYSWNRGQLKKLGEIN